MIEFSDVASVPSPNYSDVPSRGPNSTCSTLPKDARRRIGNRRRALQRVCADSTSTYRLVHPALNAYLLEKERNCGFEALTACEQTILLALDACGWLKGSVLLWVRKGRGSQLTETKRALEDIGAPWAACTLGHTHSVLPAGIQTAVVDANEDVLFFFQPDANLARVLQGVDELYGVTEYVVAPNRDIHQLIVDYARRHEVL